MTGKGFSALYSGCDLQKEKTDMAAFTNTSLVSATLEGALLEILRLVADRQTSTTTNPQNRQVVTQFTQNELTGLFTVGISLPASLANSNDGRPVATATEVFL